MSSHAAIGLSSTASASSALIVQYADSATTTEAVSSWRNGSSRSVGLAHAPGARHGDAVERAWAWEYARALRRVGPSKATRLG